MEWKASVLPFVTTFSALFAIIDPFAVIPVLLTLTERYRPAERLLVIRKSVLIAMAILMVFAISGEGIFRLFGISIPAFRIAGGILLLKLGIEQLGAQRERVKSEEEDESFERNDISIFPLATPLLAGPGAISTVVLQAGQAQGVLGVIGFLITIVLVFIAVYFLLASAPTFYRLLGKTGLNLVTRIMGIILTAIAVQFIIDGLMSVWNQVKVGIGT